ncbi:MAG: hypothetical protein ACFFCV_18780 [Promethearchaeota archaeon]
MKSKDKYLTIPINVYEGRVEIRSKIQMNPLHPYILNLVTLNNDLETVINSFQLDRRIVLEAIIDLMYKELVRVDLENSKIFNTPEVSDEIDRGRLVEFLEDEFPRFEAIKWIQDMVSGQIMTLEHGLPHFRTPLDLKEADYDEDMQVQITRRNFIPIKEYRTQTLVKVARLTLRQYIEEGNIAGRVNKIHNLHLTESRNIYIPLKKEVINDIEYDFPESETIPPSVLESWSRSLTQIDAYSISDLSPADEDFLLTYDWGTIMKKWHAFNSFLGSSISRISGTQLSRILKKQEIREILKKIDYEVINKLIPAMMEIGTSMVDVDISKVKGNKLLKILSNELQQSKELVVIGTSFINEVGIEALLPLFEELISRNVKVILLWGTLAEQVPDITSKFSIFQNDNISFVRSIKPFHSKFLLIDNKSAWITSCNLGSYWYDETSPDEIFCKLEGGTVIGEIMEYALKRISTTRIEAKWLGSMGEKFLKDNDSIIENQHNLSILKETINEMKRTTELLLEEPLNQDIIKNLKFIFEKHKSNIRQLRGLSTACLIENLDHRRFLRAVLEQATQSIQLGTDRMYRQAIGPVIISSLNKALEKNVDVEVKWGKEMLQSIPNDLLTNTRSTIIDIRTQTHNKIKISDNPSGSHAKYLSMDSSLLLVTSFNLFAFAGTGLADDEITDELGVVISSPNIAQKI